MKYASLPLTQLASWANLNQIELPNAAIAPSITDGDGNSKGGGLVATADLSPGDIVLRIPAELVLSKGQVQQHAKSDQHLRAVLDAVGPSFSQNARKAIMIFLLLQLTYSSPDFEDKVVGQSVPLTQYVGFLPKDIPLPTFYSPEQRELLAGTSLEDALVQKLQSLEREFAELQKSTASIPWCLRYWWSEDTGRLTLEDWKVVDSIYRSRGVELPQIIGDSMIPVLDMANHASGDEYNARFEYGEDGEVLLLVRDDKTVAKGKEITIMYGHGGACEMVFSYGFLDDHAESAREIFLGLRMPSDDPLAAAKVRFAKEAPGVRILRNVHGQMEWESSFVWWACVNEEDGLDFNVVQRNDGERELRASWNGANLAETDELSMFLQKDSRKDIFSLRATVLVQERVELQGSRLSESQESFESATTATRSGDFDPIVDAIHRLRKLELHLLLDSYQSLEIEKTQFLSSESVRLYLSGTEPFHQTEATNDDDDFS